MNLKTKDNVLKRFLMLFISVCLLFVQTPVYAEETAKKVQLKAGSTYSGFELVKRDYSQTVKSYINQFEHKKTGAKLIYVENNDEQKMFSITFRTPCFDNTGVNHILEHSVLCGSKKFPVKNPFAKLLNKSLNTEMNAYTYPDRTCYPVASKYDKDFKNLVSVYLDAVFAPNLLKTKNIFNQEGWRYELNSKNDEINYNGVVYNEMKGAYSKPAEVLNDAVRKSLFKDTTYKYQSGGNPEYIPTLTYEKYLEVYKKYYHPSNSYTYIYGNVDIEDMLKYINDNYFSKYEKKNINSEIQLQKTYDKQNSLQAEYNVPKEQGTKDKTYFSLNYVVDTINNKKDYVSLELLNYLMLNAPKAPLKKALKDAGFSEGNFSSSVIPILQPIESITLRNANITDKEKFNKVVTDTYKKIIKEGFDKQDIQDLLDERLKNRKLDKAFDNFLSLNATVLQQGIGQNWIYDGDPTLYIDDKDVIEQIKNEIENGDKYFEKFLSKYLLNNTHSSFVTLLPKEGLETKLNLKTKQELSKYKKNLSSKQLDALIKNCSDFKKWQDTPDSEEALNTLPKLSLEDLKKPVVNYPTEERNINNVKVLNHSVNTLGASYLKFYFDTKNIPQDKLVYINLLNTCYGLIQRDFDTKNYVKDDFNKACRKDEITITVLNNVMTKYDDNSVYKPLLTVGTVCPSDSIDKLISLINEMLFNTKFDDKEKLKEKIKENLMTYEESKKSGINAITRLQSYYSPSVKYTSDLDDKYYAFLDDLNNNFDEKIDSVIKNLYEVRDLILNKQNLTVSFTSDEENYNCFEKSLNNFSKQLGNKKFIPCEYKFDNSAKNEGYITDEKVQTVAKGYNFNKLGYKYSGSFDIVQSILNDYLFNTVRIKNGAYGAQSMIDAAGSVVLVSLNDPNLKKTLDVFDTTGNYLKNLNITDKELENYIIAALGKYDEELPPAFVGNVADGFYMFGDSADEIYKIREQILNTKIEDIHKYGDMINDILKQNVYCAAGSRDKIKENKELFTKIIDASDKISNKEGFVRLYGRNRYETSSKTAEYGWKKAQYAILADGDNFSDAVSSVPLSKKYDAPILLTQSKVLNQNTKNTLSKLNVKNVFIIGGKAAISENVEKAVKAMGIKVERLGGKDRYSTSLKIAQKFENVKGVVIADGSDFEPALSISSIAANKNMPILMTDKQNISKEVKQYINKVNAETVYAAGNFLSEKVTAGLKNVEKITGKDRYTENINIVNKFKNNFNKECIFVSRGDDFADALCGAALAAKHEAPIVLVTNDINALTKQYFETNLKDMKNIYVIGGEKVVSNEVFD